MPRNDQPVGLAHALACHHDSSARSGLSQRLMGNRCFRDSAFSRRQELQAAKMYGSTNLSSAVCLVVATWLCVWALLGSPSLGAGDGAGAASSPTTIAQLVEPYGYPLEHHRAVTRDGYVLGLFRIPHGADVHANTQVVLLRPIH
jgi:hypothetical protein